MKYYDEDKARELRAAFEAEVLRWPLVCATRMFGCPCYQAGDKLFAFLTSEGVVLTHLAERDRAKLHAAYAAKPFQAGKRVMKNWAAVPVPSPAALKKVMPFVKRSYRAASASAQIS